MIKHMKIALLSALVAGSALFTAAPPAAAYDSDAALEADGALCTRHVARSERQYGIPQRLLGAIATTETGRYHRGLGVQIPWPWAINVEGKPYFFHTKTEAVRAVERFQAQGIRSIDVGCMQINLRHHPEAFSSVNQAFEPRFNVDYAARFLRGHYDDTQSWRDAVGRYHSRTPVHAARYIGVVYNHWYGLASKGNNTRRANRHQTFVRLENSGKQVSFGGAETSAPQRQITAATGTDARVVKAATRDNSRRHYDLSIIRPASAAGHIESAPTQNVAEANSPLVLTASDEKGFTSPKVLSISAGGKVTEKEQDDRRFIRFVE